MDNYQADENEINGVNLDNYFPYQSNFDTVLYVHKRVLEQDRVESEIRERAKKAKADKKKEKYFASSKERAKNESVLEQTVRFAKTLAPIVIPPTEGAPVFYTVETCSKCRRKDKEKERKPLQVQNDSTYKRNKCKKIVETFRKERRHHEKNISITESVTNTSQSNTLDDININQSLTCTFSEQSEKKEKYIKNKVNRNKRTKDKILISESFEAVATELTDAEDTKIKVQLMNSAEKNAFCDSIRSPILNAVIECISDINNKELKEEVNIIKRIVKCNTDKLDKILDRLEHIDKHLQIITKVNAKSPRAKVSTLEELGEDIDNERSYNEEFEDRKTREERSDNKGCGEVISMKPTTSVGVRTDKPNRIPARFCWTDSDKV